MAAGTVSTIERLRGIAEPAAVGALPHRTRFWSERAIGWLVAGGLTVFAFIMRIIDLTNPNKLIFDETYYPKDAYALLQSGYERQWVSGGPAEDPLANQLVIAGKADAALLTEPLFVAHPPLGKWIIGIGIQLFGMNSFGWRIAAVVFGCALIFVTVRLARRLSGSNLIAGIAGLLLSLDGLHFTMSRTGLLDIFLAFFLVAAVSCLVADRDWFRNQLANHLESEKLPDLGREFGPVLWFRPWRLAAGVLLGMGLGTKWSAIYVIAGFSLLSLAWDLGARRLAGGGTFNFWRFLRDAIPAFITLVIVSLVVYVLTWWGWLTTRGGWGRDWGENNPDSLTVRILGQPLASLLNYHQEILKWHTGTNLAQQTHNWQSGPLSWLLMQRPVMMAGGQLPAGSPACPAPGQWCGSYIYAFGTPVLWWLGAIALIAAAILWIGNRDWRFGVPVVGALLTWAPWFFVGSRPIFYFYAIAIIPFTVIALALCLGRLLGPANGNRRLWGGVVMGVILALVGVNFAFIFPILSYQILAGWEWQARIWLQSWF